MITEDYVSFETAKLLKEKGFNEDCYGYYFGTPEYLTFGDYKQRNLELHPDSYSAPTIQMAMKWLREVHNIHINIDIHWLQFANTNGWIYTIEKLFENGVEYIESKGDENDKHFYSTYEEACEVAIKYCLKNLL